MNHQVIQPIIRQHAANAAFYWLQKEESRFSPLVKSADLRQFNQYIDANLEGLHVAGDDGWEESYAGTETLALSGRSVCLRFSGESVSESCLDESNLVVCIKYADTTLNGYVSALSHSAKEHVYGTVNEFLLSSIPSRGSDSIKYLFSEQITLIRRFFDKKAR
ncbi:hypothetical protein ACSF7A_22845 [Escherichia coli]|uniref:hypothetical protein n=1 Tax=Escherichia coli TaxID=562 RepID=UPI003EF03B14